MQIDHLREDDLLADEAALDDYEPETNHGRHSSQRGRHSTHAPTSSAASPNEVPEAQHLVSQSFFSLFAVAFTFVCIHRPCEMTLILA